jgi:hypothetical protein
MHISAQYGLIDALKIANCGAASYCLNKGRWGSQGSSQGGTVHHERLEFRSLRAGGEKGMRDCIQKDTQGQTLRHEGLQGSLLETMMLLLFPAPKATILVHVQHVLMFSDCV